VHDQVEKQNAVVNILSDCSSIVCSTQRARALVFVGSRRVGILQMKCLSLKVVDPVEVECDAS